MERRDWEDQGSGGAPAIRPGDPSRMVRACAGMNGDMRYWMEVVTFVGNLGRAGIVPRSATKLKVLPVTSRVGPATKPLCLLPQLLCLSSWVLPHPSLSPAGPAIAIPRNEGLKVHPQPLHPHPHPHTCVALK